MTDREIHELPRHEWPELVLEMSDAPKRLFIRGTLPDPDIYRYICIVGSRTHSSYGKDACEHLIRGLTGHMVCIVSGLALGIDGVAHRAALSVGLPTIAIPGSGLDTATIYPQAHAQLAEEIIDSGGALLSEFPDGGSPGVWSFPRRNRIMAGISCATLIIEGGAKSGTLITARLATEYDRDVMVVPGPIFSPQCEGSNKLLRDGAIPITASTDILETLGIRTDGQQTLDFDMTTLSNEEKKILGILTIPQSIDDIARETKLPIHTINMLVSSLEIRGILVHRMGLIERRV